MLSTHTVQQVLQWEGQKKGSSRKRQGLMTKECCYYNNKKLMNFLWGIEDEDKRRQENGQT
jgi:hypothetical protein